MVAEAHELTLAEAAWLIRARALSPVELVQALLRRIEAVNPLLDAFVTLTAERALAEARAAEAEILAGDWRGPLHGIPIGLKDIFDVSGLPTTACSRGLAGNVAAGDATVTRRLRERGAVPMGKLTTYEMAHGGPSFDLPWPPARNPWDRERDAGGSSSGAGAAVATGMVLGALGSDTGGSIRNPAAFCGVVGLKPTYGLVSRRGVVPNSFTFDHCGPLSRTVEDCAILLQAVAGFDPDDPASANVDAPDYVAATEGGIEGLRIGVVRHFWEQDLPASAEVRAAMEAAIAVFAGLGAVVREARLRPAQDFYDVKIVIGESEIYAVHERNLRARPGDFGADFLGRCLPACLMAAADYVQAQRERRRMLAEMEAIYASHDLLLTAGPYGPAPRMEAADTMAFWRHPSITTPFNVTGGPALVQCCGFSREGLPLALQLVGRPFDEATVLRAAHAYEKATPWHGRRPAVEAGTPLATNRPAPTAGVAGGIDPAVEDAVARAVRDSGLALLDRNFAQVCAAYPYVRAMTGRLSRTHAYDREPASVFVFPGWHAGLGRPRGGSSERPVGRPRAATRASKRRDSRP